MNKCFRHGEICFLKIDKLPEGLKDAKQNVFLVGSHGHSHGFDKGSIYLKKEDEFVFGYFVAKETTLTHPEHGTGKGMLKKANLPDGIYQLRRGVEFINGEMKPVID